MELQKLWLCSGRLTLAGNYEIGEQTITTKNGINNRAKTRMGTMAF